MYNVYTRMQAFVAKSDPVTARVVTSIAARLEALASVQDHTVSYLVAEALERYIAEPEWQVAEIQAAR